MKARALLALASFLLVAAGEPAAPDQESDHVVQPGEPLGGIAVRAKVPRILIAEANGLKPPYAVRTGQKLRIPRTRHHTVAAGETGFAIAYRYGVAWAGIATANGLDPSAPVRAGQELLIPTVLAKPAAAAPTAASPAPAPSASASPSAAASSGPPSFAWPIEGRIRRAFRPRSAGRDYHEGIDIDAHQGDAVRASAAGRVIYAQHGPTQYGKTVIIHHGSRWVTVYGFLDQITVKDGDRVGAGERVGFAGRSGVAKDFQVHFEVRRNREALDPTVHLPRRAAE